MSAKTYSRLIEGVRKFQTEVFPLQKERYERVMREGQEPHTLFITCADSRIDPELLTQSGPGDLFVARNIGNIVPAYGQVLGGVSSVIEYAVMALHVNNVVVCGHSGCGAMTAMLSRESVAKMPTVDSWLTNADAALSVVDALHPEQRPPDVLDRLIEANVVLQLNHLRTHPSVAGGLARKTLLVHGWVYDIAAGSIRAYDEAEGGFVKVS